MPVLGEAQARAALQKWDVSPIYVLVGDDGKGKTAFIDALSALVEPELRPFNLQHLYANERSLDEIVAAVRTVPFLGDRRVVITLRCEVFLKPKRKGATAQDEDDDVMTAAADAETSAPGATEVLERYAASPVPENVLVLVAADMARNTRLAKQLLKAATVVEYWGLKGDRDARDNLAGTLRAAEQMVRDTLRAAGLRIRPEAVEPLLEHAGTDIGVLRNDLDRLVTYCLGRSEATVDDVRAVVSGATQIDEWALTRAIQAGDTREALRQLHLGFEAGQSPWMVLGQLAWLVRARLGPQAPHRLRSAVDALFRADVALKSSGGDPDVLLERLVVELCGAPRGQS